MRKLVNSITLTEKGVAKAVKRNIIKTKIFKTKVPHQWHEIHLCYLANMGYQQQNSEEYKSLVRNPKYMCKHCGRVAQQKNNLCTPTTL